MKSVFLLGFSTTGKSTILREFKERHGATIDTLDSDEVVSRDDGQHIYKVFLRLRDGRNTGTAIRAIEDREREFLGTVGPQTKPLLIAGGPFLPIREPEWSKFVARVSPVFIYLQKDPEDVLSGLLFRREQQLEDSTLASDPGFGCWDQGVTTDYRNGRWVLIDRATALENVRRNMSHMISLYERFARHTITWRERQAGGGKERLEAVIERELGL